MASVYDIKSSACFGNRIIIEIKTAPVILDDTSELYSELDLLISDKVNLLFLQGFSADAIAENSDFCRVMSDVLSKELEVPINVKVVQHHYNISKDERTLFVGIEITPDTIELFSRRGSPSFEEIFKDFK